MQPHIETEQRPETLQLSSTAFAHRGPIPVQHTCDGADIAPPLAWSKPPPRTKSVALLVEDPDAPNTTWVHWIVTNIPPHVTQISGGRLPPGAVQGTNDWTKRAWQGPCPPHGRHRYVFTVFALDIPLDTPGISKIELLAVMKGHVLAKGELVGTYQRA